MNDPMNDPTKIALARMSSLADQVRTLKEQILDIANEPNLQNEERLIRAIRVYHEAREVLIEASLFAEKTLRSLNPMNQESVA